MAVYKATHCYPLANSLDIRVVADQEVLTPCIWLKCQVDTSNKKITGYKIRVFDTLNRQIFPVSQDEKISPISELSGVVDGESLDPYVNTGLNGSMLNVPFFQNVNIEQGSDPRDNRVLSSYNAIYYVPKYQADYVVNDFAEEGWVWNDVTLKLEKSNWDGTMEGEMVMLNETVLCLSGTYQGLWQVTEDGKFIHYKDFSDRDVNNGLLSGQYCVIKKGPSHDYVYLCSGSEYSVYSEPNDVNPNLWTDIDGNPVNINLDGTTYKWEIVLYQGNGIEIPAGTVNENVPGDTGTNAAQIDYSNLDYEWFDSVLSSGTILGTTNKRIQIASSDDEYGEIPEGNSSVPIVLQTKYVQLYDENNHMLGKRVYIQTYDATYGHIYPMTGKYNTEIINDAKYARCFKYSNDPEYILASDRVQVATTTPLTLWDGDNPVDNTGLPVIDGYTVKENDLVLVKNQSNPKENGVYVAKPSGTSWYRSGSYRKWADFMGKIIYVENGVTNGGLNFQSSAQTFGEIFNPVQGDNGENPLYFLTEQPISLFPSRIKMMTDYISLNSNAPGATQDASAYPLDGYIVNSDFVGQTFYHWRGKKAYKIISFTGTDFECEEIDTTFNDSDVIYINYGQLWGGKTIKVELPADLDNGPTIDDTPATAVVLKNKVGKTFISPYVGLSPDMAIRLQNNIKIYRTEGGVKIPTEYLRIQNINKMLWYIEHENVYKNRTDSDPMIFESMSETDSSIPYKYDICTYYKASDENPFSTYEAPYLKVIVDEDGYRFSDVIFNSEHNIENISKRYIKIYGEYHQFQQASWESYRWLLKDYTGEVIQDSGTRYNKLIETEFYGLSNDSENNSNRYKISLSVIDNYGNTLSYTMNSVVVKARKKTIYGILRTIVDEGVIKEVFFEDGVTEITNPDNLHLYLDTETRSYYEYDTAEHKYKYLSKAIRFDASFECDTHSVLLNYQDNTFVLPTYYKDQYDHVLTRGANKGYGIESVSVDDLTYNRAFVRDLNTNTSFVVNNNNDPVSHVIPLTDINNDTFNLSDIVKEGLTYAHYYTTSSESDYGLSLEPLTPNEQTLQIEETVNQGDTAYFETLIQMSDNYCGTILTYSFDGKIDNSTLSIILKTAENFNTSDYSVSGLNQDRNKIVVEMKKGDEQLSNTETKTNIFSYFDTAGKSKYYILQPVMTPSQNEYHEFYSSEIGHLYYFPKYTQQGVLEKCFNSEKSLGNCCLASNLNNAHSEMMYWNEEETLIYNTALIEKANAGINLLLEEDAPSWPDENNEEDYYWTEEKETSIVPDDPSFVYPNTLTLLRDDIQSGDFTGGQYFHLYYAMPRHPFSVIEGNTFYKVSISIDQLATLCDQAFINDLAISLTEDDASHAKFNIRPSNDEHASYGQIIITKVQ